MATATKTGFAVPCPHCGAAEGLSIAVHDLSLTCTECSEEVTRDDLRRLIADASRLLRWLDAAAE
jgi:uncharacterized protein (DUF983 family)